LSQEQSGKIVEYIATLTKIKKEDIQNDIYPPKVDHEYYDKDNIPVFSVILLVMSED
jgi:hypothetical protein